MQDPICVTNPPAPDAIHTIPDADHVDREAIPSPPPAGVILAAQTRVPLPRMATMAALVGADFLGGLDTARRPGRTAKRSGYTRGLGEGEVRRRAAKKKAAKQARKRNR